MKHYLNTTNYAFLEVMKTLNVNVVETVKKNVKKDVKTNAYNNICLDLFKALNVDKNNLNVNMRTTVEYYMLLETLKVDNNDIYNTESSTLLATLDDNAKPYIDSFIVDLKKMVNMYIDNNNKLLVMFSNTLHDYIEEKGNTNSDKKIIDDFKSFYGVDLNENREGLAFIKGMLLNNKGLRTYKSFYQTLNHALASILYSKGLYSDNEILKNFKRITSTIKFEKYSNVYTENGFINTSYANGLFKRFDFKPNKNTNYDKKVNQYLKESYTLVVNDTLFEHVQPPKVAETKQVAETKTKKTRKPRAKKQEKTNK